MLCCWLWCSGEDLDVAADGASLCFTYPGRAVRCLFPPDNVLHCTAQLITLKAALPSLKTQLLAAGFCVPASFLSRTGCTTAERRPPAPSYWWKPRTPGQPWRARRPRWTTGARARHTRWTWRAWRAAGACARLTRWATLRHTRWLSRLQRPVGRRGSLGDFPAGGTPNGGIRDARGGGRTRRTSRGVPREAVVCPARRRFTWIWCRLGLTCPRRCGAWGRREWLRLPNNGRHRDGGCRRALGKEPCRGAALASTHGVAPAPGTGPGLPQPRAWGGRRRPCRAPAPGDEGGALGPAPGPERGLAVAGRCPWGTRWGVWGQSAGGPGHPPPCSFDLLPHEPRGLRSRFAWSLRRCACSV